MNAKTWMQSLLCIACVLAAWRQPVAVGADHSTDGDPARAAQDADAALTTGTSPVEDEAVRLAAETVAAMQEARAGLADGPLTEAFDARQRAIMERLERLAELARQQSKSISGGRSSAGGGQAGQAVDSGDGQGAAGRSPDATESAEDATGQSGGERRVRTPQDLATGVWGHLPARQRDRMRSRFSERFLPQYAELVRRYYEALAAEGTKDAGRVAE